MQPSQSNIISPPSNQPSPNASKIISKPDPDKHLQNVLDRAIPSLDSTSVTFQVFGVYSLPEPWKAKVWMNFIIYFLGWRRGS